MTRKEFTTIIKIMSFWKIDKRKGNYKLPNGEHLSDYLERMTMTFLSNNRLAIASNGDVYGVLANSKGTYEIFKPFADGENVIEDEQEARVENFVKELF